VEGAFKRQNISIRYDRTEYLSKIERWRFAICSDCFDAEIGVRYVRRVERSGKSVQTPKYLNPERNNRVSSKFVRLRFAICRDSVDAEIGVRYVQRVEWSGKSI
jgi:hypothetical protein